MAFEATAFQLLRIGDNDNGLDLQQLTRDSELRGYVGFRKGER